MKSDTQNSTIITRRITTTSTRAINNFLSVLGNLILRIKNNSNNKAAEIND